MPSLPPGERVYAIGDVHGRADLLARMIGMIEADVAGRDEALVHLIFLGDLIDRGPASARVVEIVRALLDASQRVRLLKGNHEEIFVSAARGCSKAARSLLGMGGYETLESYGISREDADLGTMQDLADLLEKRIPEHHVNMLDRAEDMIVMGDYVFVHAGIRPGVHLDRQHGNDLRWIRRPFLEAQRNDGHVVIHGHTPTADIDYQSDRIGIDTGACYSGKLTALALEGAERWTLQT
ncbi:metallophosphoesterase family protein [Sphingomonas oligophenolica]